MFDRAGFEAAVANAGQRSSEIEANGTLPTDLVDGLVDTGVFRLWVPTHLGGSEADVVTVLDAIEEAAYHDGSTGWCVMIGCTTSLNSGFLPEPFGKEIYGDPRAVTGGFGMPAGVGTVVEGGISVSGTWAWGSGAKHCTWIGGGVRIPETKQAPFVYFDPADVEFANNWQVSGMKGTGSGDYTVTNAFVPDGRWVNFAAQAEPTSDSPLYRFLLPGSPRAGSRLGHRWPCSTGDRRVGRSWREEACWQLKGPRRARTGAASAGRSRSLDALCTSLHSRDRRGVVDNGCSRRSGHR